MTWCFTKGKNANEQFSVFHLSEVLNTTLFWWANYENEPRKALKRKMSETAIENNESTGPNNNRHRRTSATSPRLQ